MPKITIDSSVHEIDAQFAKYPMHRPTVVCCVVAPASGKIALVQTARSARRESQEHGLKMPQGGTDGEQAVRAYFRELKEEVGLPVAAITQLYGLPLYPTPIGGRARDGYESKAYGLILGITDGTPPLAPLSTDEIAHADWSTLDAAGQAFRAQADGPHKRRGERSLAMLGAIYAKLAALSLQPPQMPS